MSVTGLSPAPNSRPSSSSNTPPSDTIVAPPSEQGLSRRARPSHVQTNLPPNRPPPQLPPSAISNSSMASSPLQESPIMTPEAVEVTANSSVQPSPDPCDTDRGRAMSETFPPLQLPESLEATVNESTLSRKTSTNSLGVGSLASPLPPATIPEKAGLVRRTSNSVRRAAGSLIRRRPSSTHPKSRDASVGPGVYRLRQRSNSNNVTPAENAPTFTDSDEDPLDEKEDIAPCFGGDGAVRDLEPLSAIPPNTGSTSTVADTTGPVVPLALRQGTPMGKASKKKKKIKRITLVLDPDAAKIWWDRNRSSKTIYLDDIKEIRTAPDIRQYLLDTGLDESHASRFFTIIYAEPDKPGHKTLHLVADNDGAFKCWTEALEAISKHRQDFAISLMSFNDKAIRAYWNREMAKQATEKPGLVEETIDLPGVERVCRNLHIHVSSQVLHENFGAALKLKAEPDDTSASRAAARLDFAGFIEFVHLMKTRKDIRAIYREHALDIENGLTLPEFLSFVQRVQSEDITDLAYWEGVFSHFARKVKMGVSEEVPRMGEAALAGFLTSTYNPVVPKEPQNYRLDRPMNEYYISSSHNTYLLGRQVAGVSSNEGYIAALMRGCRCVEIDCWDGPDNQPIVVHGRTLTSEISFLEVIKTINKYAFVKTHFPLWISLEVRCNLITQANMAAIMKDIFGEKLVQAPLDSGSQKLPVPSDLMDRILIKVKKPTISEPLKSGELFKRRRSDSQSSPYQRAQDNGIAPQSPLLSPTPRSTRQIETINEGEVHELQNSSPSESDSDSERDSTNKTISKIDPSLGNLGVYGAGIPFNGFDSHEAKDFNHIFSFKERTFWERSQPGEDKRALYRHNMRYMMRVYPNASRISSSNFDPLIYWKRGVQMAALNWQTFDLGMQINQAMFDGGTDQSGYVLKPVEAREIQGPFHGEVGKRVRKNISFKIDVISAQQLMRPYALGEKRTVDPYVEVEVFLADDKRNKDAVSLPPIANLKYRTKIVRENGFNPEFDGTHTFNVMTKYPHLIFVRWSVKLADSRGGYNDKPPLATFTAKLSNLKQGYRTLPLLDSSGDRYLFSTLFCRIKTDSTDVIVPYPDDSTEANANKLKRKGGVFRNNGSPKSSMDSGGMA